jgi:hypothetical protein
VPECKRRFGALALPRSLPDHIGCFSAITTIVVLALPDTKSGMGVDHPRVFDPAKSRDHHASSMIAIIGRDKLNIEITEREKTNTRSPKVPSESFPTGNTAMVP